MLIKRIFDICCAVLGLIILAPLFLFIAILIKITSPGPVFFRQIRVGRFNQPFAIFKFRTMIVNAELIGPKITIGEDQRITKVGKILRKTKFDELPQLIDVVRGKMSIVGPRPEVPEYVKLYQPSIKRLVLSVRPGITDWASILMIDESKILAKYPDPKAAYINYIMPEKLSYAVKYVKTRTFGQDCKIILATLIKILKR